MVFHANARMSRPLGDMPTPVSAQTSVAALRWMLRGHIVNWLIAHLLGMRADLTTHSPLRLSGAQREGVKMMFLQRCKC